MHRDRFGVSTPRFYGVRADVMIEGRQSVAESDRWSHRGMAVTALCFLLNMCDGVNIFALTYVAPVLQREFSASTGHFGVVFSAGLLGMAIGGLGLAPLADRFGRRPLILFALTLMAGAMFASACAPGVWSLAADRVAVGVGIGTVLASITALSAGFAPDRWRHVAAGLPQAGYPVGATLAGFVTAWALPRYHWQGIFVGAGAVTLLFLPLCLWALPEAPDRRLTGHLTLAQALGGRRKRNSQLLWLCSICGFMALYFIASWITRLAIAAGLPPTQAIIASAVYNLGACAGTIAISVAARKIDLRKLVCASLGAASALFLFFGSVRMGLAPLLFVSFLIGITLQGGVNANYPLVASAYPAEARATGLGWAMGVGRIGAMLGPLVGGFAIGEGLPLVAVFGIFCVPMLVTGVAALWIRFD